MRIIHGSGYDEPQRKEFIKRIHENILDSITVLINFTKHFKIKYEDADNSVSN
jgi:hypothetical protein